ncbi:MAG TPA: phosphoglucosamine mutase, partial [Fimbriimonadaceae bacterium]|nr:phosphoglucosamine mutase [Fimbriimonadaceae bacterium]
MSGPRFGTDGIRGVANADLTPEVALSLGLAAGGSLVQSGVLRRVVVGRDTRRSGDMLEAALVAGFTSSGVDVVQLGIAPTPAVAFITRKLGFGMGAVISASHNPAPDNGIKLFGAEGAKLPDEIESEIEAAMGRAPSARPT